MLTDRHLFNGFRWAILAVEAHRRATCMLRFLPIALSVLFLSSCANQAAVSTASAPAATVVLRDGTTVQGKVVESSATEIKIATADLQTRIIPMSTVRRVDYGETAPAVEPKAAANGKPVAA